MDHFHKRFSQTSFEKFKKYEVALLKNISIENHTLQKNDDPFGIDILIYNGTGKPVGGLEAECHSKYWTDEDFPFRTVHFLFRKKKYINRDHFYIMMNKGATNALLLPFSKLKKYKPREISNSVVKRELMYDIPIFECVWGWKAINKYLNKHFRKI